MYIDSSNGKIQLSLPFSSWRANCCECDAVFSPEGGQEITTHLDSAEKNHFARKTLLYRKLIMIHWAKHYDGSYVENTPK